MSDAFADSLVAAAREILIANGPMEEDELADALDAAGVDLDPADDHGLADLLDDHREPIQLLADERLAWIPAVLDGRVFTHRLSAAEAEHDVIAWNPDLAPVSMLTESEDYRQLADGAPISEAFAGLDDDFATRGVPETVDPGGGVLLLPPGRFAALGATAGDLVGVRVTERGLEIHKVDEVAPCGAGEALTELLEGYEGEPEMLDAAVWTVCADDDSLFREPTAPLGELLSDCGLDFNTGWVAPAGFDFANWRMVGRAAIIAARHELSFEESLAVLAAVRLYDQTLDLLDAAEAGGADGLIEAVKDLSGLAPTPAPVPRPDRTTVGMALESLAEPAVVSAFLEEIDYGSEGGGAGLFLFAETLEPLAPRPIRPALRWLRGKAFELLGDLPAAETAFESAESLDPSWPLTLLSLARYASDRGDAERGLSLLRRAGAPDDHQLVLLLRHFLPAPRKGLGRNEKCWCGSGRKYKVCHLNREQLPLEERAAWLYQKSAADLAEGEFAPLLVQTVTERARHWDSPDALAQALDDGCAIDTVLFEGGAFADFLDRRGSLLPDDERLLAEQWLLAERSVHEVLAVRRGEGMTLRDVRTGDVHEVRERSGSAYVTVGGLYCARVVPAGETMQIFGGIEPVSVGERDRLIALLDDEPDPVELVALLSRRFAPPALRNTEGEPLMFCDATLTADDPAALSEALDGAYGAHDEGPDGTRSWFEHIMTDGLERIRAQFELRGDELHVHANSQARFERALEAVRQLAPAATLLRETREPVEDARALQRLADRAPSGPAGASLDPAEHPELAAALDEMALKFEAAWLDEPIPALSGHTPRECADDPTRRPDLIRLLDSFGPDTGEPGMMSTRRLRAALGLD